MERSATPREIRRAYRNLARQYHPDTHPGDAAATEHLRLLNTAVAVLSDPAQRQAYDLAIASSLRGIGPDIALLSKDNGYDVVYPVYVTRTAAEAGATCWLEFHNAGGAPYRVPIVVPPNSQPGDRLRVLGAGGPNHEGTRRGDLIAVVRLSALEGAPSDGVTAEGAEAAGTYLRAIIVALLVAVILVAVAYGLLKV